jgi:hypothetical protein
MEHLLDFAPTFSRHTSVQPADFIPRRRTLPKIFSGKARFEIQCQGMSGAGNGEGQEKPEVSRLLVAWAAGDGAALDRLAPLVYPKLRAIARRYLRNERVGHTLQTTALVNEAFLDLVGDWKLAWVWLARELNNSAAH